jgi:hypothetical protein
VRGYPGSTWAPQRSRVVRELNISAVAAVLLALFNYLRSTPGSNGVSMDTPPPQGAKGLYEQTGEVVAEKRGRQLLILFAPRLRILPQLFLFFRAAVGTRFRLHA